MGFFSWLFGKRTTSNNNEAIAKITARRMGQQIVRNNPKNKKQLLAYCKAVLDSEDENISEIVIEGLRKLSKDYADDELIADDLLDIMSLVGINLSAPDVQISDTSLIKSIIKAFQTGIKVG